MDRKPLHVSDVPEMMRFWDYEKNTEDPALLSPGSKHPAFWKCPDCGYTWSSTIAARYVAKPICPCHELGRAVLKGFNDVLTVFPNAEKYYDFETNEKNCIDIYALTVKSNKRVHWKCPVCGYEWDSTIKIMNASGFKCPCHETRKRIQPGYNDYLTLLPDAAREYDFAKNKENGIDIYHEGIASEKIVAWKCPDCGREWTTSLFARAKKDKTNGEYYFSPCPHFNTAKRKTDDVPPVSDVPSLMEFWDPENQEDPHTVLSNSVKPYKWKCKKCGYSWTKKPVERMRLSDMCPCCGQNRVISEGVNDFLTAVPELKRWFLYEENKDIDYHAFGVGNDTVKLWWKCPDCGFRFQSTVANRIIHSASGKRAVRKCRKCGGFISVAQVPSLMKFWSERLNISISPNDIFPSSNTNVFWECPKCGYTWKQSPRQRKKHIDECPYCDLHAVLYVGHNDVLTLLPELARFFDAEAPENTDIDLHTFGINAKQPVAWKCPDCGYRWTTRICSRIIKNKDGTLSLLGCSRCDRAPIRKMNYAEQYPELALVFDVEANGKPLSEIVPQETYDAPLFWLCSECGNHYTALFHSMVRNYNVPTKCCPYCSGRKVDETNSLATLYPELAKMWSSENPMPSNEAFPDGKIERKWVCTTCHCNFTAKPYDMVRGLGCPYCTERLTDPNRTSLKAKYPKIAKMFSPRNPITADRVHYASKCTYYWTCPECGRESMARLIDVVSGKYTCPYCNERKVIPETTSLKAMYPEIAAHWSDKNAHGPETVSPTSSRRYLWHCNDCGNDYYASPQDRVNGADCPYCNDTKVMPGFNSLKARHPELMAEWIFTTNTLLGVDPDAISERSDKHVWWQCKNDPTHHYPMTVGSRLMFQKRHREPCPYCKGRRVKQHHFVMNKIRSK